MSQLGSLPPSPRPQICTCNDINNNSTLYMQLICKRTLSLSSSWCAVSVVDDITHFTPLALWPRIASTARVVLPLLWGPMTKSDAPRPRGVSVSRAFTPAGGHRKADMHDMVSAQWQRRNGWRQHTNWQQHTMLHTLFNPSCPSCCCLRACCACWWH